MAVLNERYATPARSIWEWANPLPHFAPDASRKAGAAVCGFVQDRDRIVTDHGFWELGRFSVALFGESPSVTLRRPAEQGFTSRLMMPAPVLTSARRGRLLWRSNSSGEAMSATPNAGPASWSSGIGREARASNQYIRTLRRSDLMLRKGRLAPAAGVLRAYVRCGAGARTSSPWEAGPPNSLSGRPATA
jgi:hypothetical protein